MAKVRSRVGRSALGNASTRRSNGFREKKSDIGEKYQILQKGGKINFPVEPEERERIHAQEYLEAQFEDGHGRAREYVGRKGEDYKADTPKQALELFHREKISKSELPIIAFTLGLINDPDDCSVNKALNSLKQASEGQVVVEEGLEELVRQNTGLASSKNQKRRKGKKKAPLMTPEERLEYQRKAKKRMKEAKKKELVLTGKPKVRFKKKVKGQYSNEAYTGNGGSRPGTHTEEDTQIEEKGESTRYDERQRKLLKKKNLQPKSDTDGAVEQFSVEDPRNEGLKSAMKNISSELDSLSVSDLQDIKEQVSFLIENNAKSSIVVSEDTMQMPSPEDIAEQIEYPELVDDLRSNFN